MHRKSISLGLLFFPLFLLSCSLFVQSVPSDVLYINTWTEHGVDFNPGGSYNFVRTAQTTANILGKRINPAAEPVVEYSTSIGRDGSLYIAYTTRVNSAQTVTVEDNNGTTVSNIYEETLEDLGQTRNLTIYRVFDKTINSGIISYIFNPTLTKTNEPAPIGKIVHDTGVWARLLRYNPNNPSAPWTVEYATERPAVFSNPKIVFIPGRTFPYIAVVSNSNRLAVFGAPNKNSPIEYLTSAYNTLDLHSGRNPASVSQLSTWNEKDRTYISFIEDNKNVIGYFRSLKWQENYFDIWSGRTPTIFSMTSSQGETYGVWWNPIDQLSVVSAYATNGPPNTRWKPINSMSATESPKIKTRYYFDQGFEKLDVYLGTVYGATKFFQLSIVSNRQVSHIAPPLDGYNNRYNFDIDSRGNVVYARINAGGSIDVATWTHGVWISAERPLKFLTEQDVIRTPYKVFPSSSIESLFVNGTRPFIIFIEDTGYLQMLEGQIQIN